MKRYFFLTLCLLSLGLWGCNHSQTVSPERLQQGQKFIEALQNLPPEERRKYCTDHPDQVQSVTTSGDQKLMTQFMQLTQASK